MKPPPISKYARDQTRVRLGYFKTNLRHTAKHPGDPGAIHDLRVSIRRLTQCFRVFGAPGKKVRRRLHKIMEQCGAVRNCDIALELLAECGLRESPSVPILEDSREDAARKLRRRLKKERRRHPLALDAAPRPSNSWQIATRLPALAEDFFQTGDAAAAPAASYQTQHRFRLRAKRFRYTLELFERLYGSEMTTAAKALKSLQDRLGAINDCVTSIGLLDDDSSAIASIQKLLNQRTHAFQTYWRSTFPPQKRAWWRHWLKQPGSLKAISTASSGSATHRG